jgi:hypothetical protein
VATTRLGKTILLNICVQDFIAKSDGPLTLICTKDVHISAYPQGAQMNYATKLVHLLFLKNAQKKRACMSVTHTICAKKSLKLLVLPNIYLSPEKVISTSPLTKPKQAGSTVGLNYRSTMDLIAMHINSFGSKILVTCESLFLF